MAVDESVARGVAPSPKPLAPVGSIVKRRSLIVPIAIVCILLIVGALFLLTTTSHPRSDLLATVNGEPIYASDIDATMKLVPPQYQTNASRDSFLNQTIDLLLLKQEAARRGVTVSPQEIDTRVDTVLNDTGHSPQELRIILAEQNLTVEDYRSVVEDSLIVEKLTTEAITSHITVTENDIVTYYQTHQSEFLPPKDGARISHILVTNETTARTVIAQLNQGVSFRELALKYSIDNGSKADGGMLGIVLPTSALPIEFVQAALALAQNQYTRTPVKTAYGYHVIFRNFDIPDVQEVRDAIQQKLLIERQQEGFAALLNGLHASASIKLYTPNGAVSTVQAPSIEGFAACVGKRSTLYGESWSDSFHEQEAYFGSAASLLTVTDCGVYVNACASAGIQKYPTWIIDGKQYGKLSLSEIADKTGCTLPK